MGAPFLSPRKVLARTETPAMDDAADAFPRRTQHPEQADVIIRAPWIDGEGVAAILVECRPTAHDNDVRSPLTQLLHDPSAEHSFITEQYPAVRRRDSGIAARGRKC